MNKLHCFVIFRNSFLHIISASFTMVAKNLLVENLQVAGGQLRNPPAKFRCNISDLGEYFFLGLCKTLAGDRII